MNFLCALTKHVVCNMAEMCVYSSSTCCGRNECLIAAICLKTVVGVSKDMLRLKYFHFSKASFLSQSNFMKITRLSLC